MIELPTSQLAVHARAFPVGAPGPATLAEHVAAGGAGRLWADRAVHPRALAVECAGHVLLRGDPAALAPGALEPFAGRYVEAPERFLPLLGASCGPVVAWERLVYVRQEAPVAAPRPPRGVSVRRLVAADAPDLAALDDGSAWIHASWGGPVGLAASGYGWGAFHKGRLAAVACSYFVGGAYEDIAVVTTPDQRRRRLALACVAGLCADVAARGRGAGWSCSRHNRPSRLLAWNAGFRLVREYTHYATATRSPRLRAA